MAKEDLIEGAPNYTKMRGCEASACLSAAATCRLRRKRARPSCAQCISSNTRPLPPALPLAQLIDKHISTHFSSPFMLVVMLGAETSDEPGMTRGARANRGRTNSKVFWCSPHLPCRVILSMGQLTSTRVLLTNKRVFHRYWSGNVEKRKRLIP